MSESFKQAMIALQAGGRNGFYRPNDQLNIMLQLGRVRNEIVRDNKELIVETLNALYD